MGRSSVVCITVRVLTGGPPIVRPNSPRDEDKDGIVGPAYYGDSPHGSPNRDSFSESVGEGSYRTDIGLTDKDLIDIGKRVLCPID